jgi:hypothetical protein
MGESLVGAYMRQVRGCHTIAYNTFLPWGQGELDVIGVALPENGGRVRVWLAEVAVHLEGLNYGGYHQTAEKVAAKVAAAQRYAQLIYPEADTVVELWSPVVPSGLVTLLEPVVPHLVVNATFTARVEELLGKAAGATRMSGDPAFRLLQVLTHLRGAKDLRLR